MIALLTLLASIAALTGTLIQMAENPSPLSRSDPLWRGTFTTIESWKDEYAWFRHSVRWHENQREVMRLLAPKSHEARPYWRVWRAVTFWALLVFAPSSCWSHRAGTYYGTDPARH